MPTNGPLLSCVTYTQQLAGNAMTIRSLTMYDVEYFIYVRGYLVGYLTYSGQQVYSIFRSGFKTSLV
jgi:hypothetical protein